MPYRTGLEPIILYSYTAMSQGWKNGQWELFKCPLCGSRKYVPVIVQRPSGTWYTTSFYRCFSCSVMFTDPVVFAKCDASPGPEPFGSVSRPWDRKADDGE